MVIIVGLGNFGARYDNTYHNLGFMVVDKLAEEMGIELDKKKYNSLCGEGFFDGEKILLCKPTTFMNNSGLCLAALKKKFKDSRIIVVVDDIDLPAGKIRYRANGSSGTHNGLRSIVSFIGEDFERVRVGSGRDENMDLADFVLSKIKDKDLFDKACKEASEIIKQKIKEKC